MTSAIDIVIDSRESNIVSFVDEYYRNEERDDIRNGIRLVREQLDVGDVQIRFGSGMLILIERKTCADMAASLKDGRYKEQKARILSCVPSRHVIYILEGAPSQHTLLISDFSIHGLKPSVISGMMIHTMLRDGVHIINVANTRETAAWVWAIALKCFINPEKISCNEEKKDYLHQVKTKKISNITPDNCYIMQLCQVPGISITIAREISKKYNTMFLLLTTLSQLSDENSRIKCLNEIDMVGKKKARTLLEYLMPSVTSSI